LGTRITPEPIVPLRVLVIEDELKVAEALRQGLAAESYDVDVARTG
jgi:DNA-binding response OmpR family regulator